MDYQNLSQCLSASMSPSMEIRKPAENYLLQLEKTPGFSPCLFQIIKEHNQQEIKISASITFKNFVKRNWTFDEFNDDKISKEERDFIKDNIIELMLQNTSTIQNQLSEAVSIIGKNDFPEQWPLLLPQLVQKIQEGNFTIINGVLRTCHSLFKRYRSEGRSDELWRGIKEVISKLALPLTQLIQQTMSLIEQHVNDKNALSVLWSSILLICKIFYSLNYQDLPEYFEDNMTLWMTQFHVILNSKTELDGSNEATIMENVKTEVCGILSLYASKYDEEFTNFLGTFITDVYTLMKVTTTSPQFDMLISAALNFLGIVVNKPQHCAIFNSLVDIQQLCLQIIIPNIEIQLSDQETFEDNPEEYIRRDIEGSNAHTRRKSSCELVKSLNKYQENKVVANFGQYIEQLLVGYAADPVKNWKMKDSALFLVTSVASQGETERSGVTSTTEFVDVKSFYKVHIFPELQHNPQGNVIIKADCIKYLMTFRTLLAPEDLRVAINMLIIFASNASHVVHSYAAAAINKLLMVKDVNHFAVITGEHIINPTSFITALCGTMSIKGSEDNIYTMQAIMRSLSTLQNFAMDSMNFLVTYLKDKLILVVKNPRKPLFNHSLIESLALCIKLVCKGNKDFVTSFESILCPIFNDILVGDIEEFLPYTFQLFSLMLDQHPPQQIRDPYVQLFPFLVHPALWEKNGNIPSLIRLLLSYLEKSNGSIISDKLQDMANIFQRLNNNRTLDSFGFSLITAVIIYLPREQTEKYMKSIFTSIFQRLSKNKTQKYLKGFLLFFSSITFVYPSSDLVLLINSLQPNLFQMTLDSAIVPTINVVTVNSEKKICLICMIKMITTSEALITGNYSNYWTIIMTKVMESISTYDSNENNDKEAHFIDVTDSRSTSTNHNQLLFVAKKSIDPTIHISDLRLFLAESLTAMSNVHGQRFSQLYGALDGVVQETIKQVLLSVGINI